MSENVGVSSLIDCTAIFFSGRISDTDIVWRYRGEARQSCYVCAAPGIAGKRKFQRVGYIAPVSSGARYSMLHFSLQAGVIVLGATAVATNEVGTGVVTHGEA